MVQQQETRYRTLKYLLTVAGILTLGGCTGCSDVEYNYNVPAAANECPAGMNFRSGGAGIVDRSGGSGIVDRNGSAVIDYCYAPTCTDPDFALPAEIEWHLNSHQTVVAKPHCPAPIIQPPPCNCEGDDAESDDEAQTNTEDGPTA